jgi:hypothetical protein
MLFVVLYTLVQMSNAQEVLPHKTFEKAVLGGSHKAKDGLIDKVFELSDGGYILFKHFDIKRHCIYRYNSEGKITSSTVAFLADKKGHTFDFVFEFNNRVLVTTVYQEKKVLMLCFWDVTDGDFNKKVAELELLDGTPKLPLIRVSPEKNKMLVIHPAIQRLTVLNQNFEIEYNRDFLEKPTKNTALPNVMDNAIIEDDGYIALSLFIHEPVKAFNAPSGSWIFFGLNYLTNAHYVWNLAEVFQARSYSRSLSSLFSFGGGRFGLTYTTSIYPDEFFKFAMFDINEEDLKYNLSLDAVLAKNKIKTRRIGKVLAAKLLNPSTLAIVHIPATFGLSPIANGERSISILDLEKGTIKSTRYLTLYSQDMYYTKYALTTMINSEHVLVGNFAHPGDLDHIRSGDLDGENQLYKGNDSTKDQKPYLTIYNLKTGEFEFFSCYDDPATKFANKHMVFTESGRVVILEHVGNGTILHVHE